MTTTGIRPATRRVPWAPTLLLLIAALAATLLAGGCASTSEAADSARRRDLVLVPKEAQPVDEIRWRDVRGVQPLNRRMVLLNADRPYLLVLQSACQGLRSDSVIVVENTGTFSPRVDSIWVVDPFSDFGQSIGVAGVGGVGTLGGQINRNTLMAGATICRPDALYALRDEDAQWVRESLARR